MFAVFGFLAGGLIAGWCLRRRRFAWTGRLSVFLIWLLLFLLGLEAGGNRMVMQSLPSLGLEALGVAVACAAGSCVMALLPLCTVIGTLAASALMGLLLPHRSVQETMAVGSGFAYYSLSSIIITEYEGAELGTVALVANIVREFITLLAAPLLARWFGPLAPIAAGGATTADVTLPIITKTCGERYAVLSIYHGFVVDFSVPFLVTFFCVL